MSSKVSRCALYVLLMTAAAMVGVAVGFAVAYVYKDCDSDSGNDDNGVPKPTEKPDNCTCVPKPTEEANETAFVHPLIVFNHAPGPCKLVDGIEDGSEDIVAVPLGLAIITAGMKYFLPPDRPDLLTRNGSLKLFDFNNVDGGASVIPITNEDNFDYANFNPHGLSAWVDADTGQVLVFVVNHNHVPDKIETMEKFEFDQSSRMLTHLETISHENMVLMNNVKATGPNTFYYTNFLSTNDAEEGREELDEGTPTGSIGYYDGTNAHILRRRFSSPNGINVSPDGKFLYVAEFGKTKFHTFKIGDLSITPHKEYDLFTGPDNLDVVGDYVWIGCHLYHDSVFEYLDAPNTKLTSSQVLRLKMKEGEVTEVTEVFMDDGRKFSGITVAVTYGNQMIMGSVFSKAMYCDLTYVG